MTPLQRLVSIRMGGGVERCHTVRHLGSCSNAAHSWGVATIMYVLWPADFLRLAAYCIFHDVPEAWVGDIPAPAKKYDPTIKDATTRMEREIFNQLRLPNDNDLIGEDKAKLRACDSLELYFWAREQMTMGNMHAACVIRELEGFFVQEPLPAVAQQLLEELRVGSVEYDLAAGYRLLFPGS